MIIGDSERIDISGIDTMEGTLLAISKLVHSSDYTARKDVAGVFLKQGKQRYTTDIEIDTAIDAPETSRWARARINNIQSERVMKEMIYSLSRYRSSNKRKSMMMYFLVTGSAYDFREIYKLDVSDEVAKAVGEDVRQSNIEINNQVNSFFENSDQDIRTARENFYRKIKANFPDFLYDALIDAGDLINTEHTGNISHFITRTYEINEVELLNENKLLFLNAFTEYHKMLVKFQSPSESMVCDFFDMKRSTFKDNKKDALKTIRTLFGDPREEFGQWDTFTFKPIKR